MGLSKQAKTLTKGQVDAMLADLECGSEASSLMTFLQMASSKRCRHLVSSRIGHRREQARGLLVGRQVARNHDAPSSHARSCPGTRACTAHSRSKDVAVIRS
jgi:hypothetical protein